MARRSTWKVILAWLVVGAAFWRTATLFPLLDLNLTREYLVLAGLAGLSELVAVTLPYSRLSTGFAVLLAARLVWGPAPAVWIWALATLAAQGIANRGNPLHTTVFNAGELTLAAVVAACVPPVFPGTGNLALAGQSLVFTLAYALTGLLLLIFFQLPDRRGTPSRFPDELGWDLFSYLVTWPFGLAMAIVFKSAGLGGLALLFIPLLAVSLVWRRLVRSSAADRELAVWHDLAGRSAVAWEAGGAFRLVVAAAARLVPCQGVVLFLWSPEENCFTVTAAHSGTGGDLSALKLFREQALPDVLAKERKPVLIRDSRLEKSHRGRVWAGEPGPAQLWRSLVLFPLLAGDEPAGILVVGDRKPGAFTEQDKERLVPAVALAARVASGVLLERRLQEVSATDALTGLYNRRYFLLRAAEEGERCHRFGTEFAVLLLALDSLEEVGEKFGRAGAENLLAAAADLLAAAVRPVDLAARYGERDLAVLMPETGLKEAPGLVGNLAGTLRAREFPLGTGSSVQLAFRVAWGVYPRQADDVAGLFRRLELLLAQAASRYGRARE